MARRKKTPYKPRACAAVPVVPFRARVFRELAFMTDGGTTRGSGRRRIEELDVFRGIAALVVDWHRGDER